MPEVSRKVGDRFLSSAGAGKTCALSMRVPNPSPVLDKNRAPMGPEILSNTGAVLESFWGGLCTGNRTVFTPHLHAFTKVFRGFPGIAGLSRSSGPPSDMPKSVSNLIRACTRLLAGWDLHSEPPSLSELQISGKKKLGGRFEYFVFFSVPGQGKGGGVQGGG